MTFDFDVPADPEWIAWVRAQRSEGVDPRCASCVPPDCPGGPMTTIIGIPSEPAMTARIHALTRWIRGAELAGNGYLTGNCRVERDDLIGLLLFARVTSDIVEGR